MEEIYLIEIRLGKTKWRIRETIVAFAARFRLKRYIERHPHVTLFGPLTLNEGTSQQLLLDTIAQVASGYDPLAFTIDGWEKREGMHGSVIAFPVRPSSALKDFTTTVAGMLSPLARSHNRWDANPEKKWFHVTVANRLDPPRAAKVFSALTLMEEREAKPAISYRWSFAWLMSHVHKLLRSDTMHRIRPVTLDEIGLRITVLQGEKILAEYDLLEKRWVFGEESHASRSWQNTLARYRQRSGLELTAPRPAQAGEIFLIADLHLGHANIIRYCSRPFLYTDVAEMDRVLIMNWNCVVSARNTVYYLGDLRYGHDALSAMDYRNKLHGEITFITGNHDDPMLGSVPSSLIECKGFFFLLVHDPADTPPDFDGWVIHGHHHNMDLRHFPFINFAGRRINVSAEVIGYAPVSVNEICTLIQSRIASGDTRPVLTKYPYVD